MQTFLPAPSFQASAAALDDRRLGKQRVETFQILRALVFPSYGWKNHPAVAMWRGFTPALVGYGLCVCAEWERRGYADAVAASILTFTGGRVPDLGELRLDGRLPPWLGDEALHHSHRSALMGKDPAHYSEVFAGPAGPPPGDLPYVWPRPLFPRWPVRRSAALPLDAALTATGLAFEPRKRSVKAAAAATEAALTAAAAVAAGVAGVEAGASVAIEDATLALAVALAVAPPALWVPETPDARADDPAAALSPARTDRPPGTLAGSIARPAGPADIAAMTEEAGADVGVVVHPRRRLADPAVRERLAARPPYVLVRETATGAVVTRWRPGSI